MSVAKNTTPTITNLRKAMKYRISTTSLTDTSMSLIDGANTLPDVPTIHFTRKTWVKQCHLVDKSPKEVGWFALVEHDAEHNIFTITDLVIPHQEVSATETNISKDELADAATELLEQGKDTSKMYAWFHSHVDMTVSPSAQDEFQVEDYLEDLADQPDIPAFIRGIQNKKGDLKLDVYFIHHGIVYPNVKFYVIHNDDPQWCRDIDAEIASKIRDAPVSYYNSWYSNTAATNSGLRRNKTTEDSLTPLPFPLPDEFVSNIWWQLEYVYQSPTDVDVMSDTNGRLYVADKYDELYDYEEWVEAFGEVGDSDYTTRESSALPAPT
jgi:hypothetical protein